MVVSDCPTPCISRRKAVQFKQGNLESLVHGKRARQVREGAVRKGLSNQYLAGRLLHRIW